MGQETSKPITLMTKRAEAHCADKENTCVPGLRLQPRSNQKAGPSQVPNSENITANLVKTQHKASLSQHYATFMPQPGLMKRSQPVKIQSKEDSSPSFALKADNESKMNKLRKPVSEIQVQQPKCHQSEDFDTEMNEECSTTVSINNTNQTATKNANRYPRDTIQKANFGSTSKKGIFYDNKNSLVESIARYHSPQIGNSPIQQSPLQQINFSSNQTIQGQPASRNLILDASSSSSKIDSAKINPVFKQNLEVKEASENQINHKKVGLRAQVAEKLQNASQTRSSQPNNYTANSNGGSICKKTSGASSDDKALLSQKAKFINSVKSLLDNDLKNTTSIKNTITQEQKPNTTKERTRLGKKIQQMAAPQDICLHTFAAKQISNTSKADTSETEVNVSKNFKRGGEPQKILLEKKFTGKSRPVTPADERCIESTSRLLDKSCDRNKDLTTSRIFSKKNCSESDPALSKSALKPKVQPRNASYYVNLVNQTTTPNIQNVQSKISELIQRDKKLSKTKNNSTFEDKDITISVKCHDSIQTLPLKISQIPLDPVEKTAHKDINSISESVNQLNLNPNQDFNSKTDRIPKRREEGRIIAAEDAKKREKRDCELRRARSQLLVENRKLQQINGENSSDTEPVSDEEESNIDYSTQRQILVKTKDGVRHPLSHKSSDMSAINDKSYREELSQKGGVQPKANAVHATPQTQKTIVSSQQNSDFRDRRMMSIDSQKSLNAPYLHQSMDAFSQFSSERRISNSSAQYMTQYSIQDPRHQNLRLNTGFGYIPQPQPNYNLQPLLISPTNLMPAPQNFGIHNGYTQVPPRGLINCISPTQYVQVQPQFPLHYQQNYGRSVTPIESNLPFSPNQNQMIITNRGYENNRIQGVFPQQMRNPLSSPNAFSQQVWDRPMPVTQVPQLWNNQIIVQPQNQGMTLYPFNGMQRYQTLPQPQQMVFDNNPSTASFQTVTQSETKNPSIASFDARTQSSACKTLRS